MKVLKMGAEVNFALNSPTATASIYSPSALPPTTRSIEGFKDNSEKEKQNPKMENCSSLDTWAHRPSAFAGGDDSAGLLSESSSAVSTAAVPSPESLSSYPPPRRYSPTGRVARKRKSRTSKRSSTTYIAASPAHFRELVQRVTGNRSADGEDPPATVEAGIRGFSPLDASPSSVFDPAGFFWPGGIGLVPDPGIAEFDPLLLAASGFPTLDSWHMI